METQDISRVMNAYISNKEMLRWSIDCEKKR